MARIATYVFIDLETTSLPKLEHNKTRITELSMVVVKRRHILETRPGAAPRVQHKFTMCFNPRRMIDPESTATSGLCNNLLEYEPSFNRDVFDAINCFLQCLEKPVCLVAQNGYNFDFPILKNHFEKLNVCLSDDIMCADSLYAFVDIFESDSSASVIPSVLKNESTTVESDSSVNRTVYPKTSDSLVDQRENNGIADKVGKEVTKMVRNSKQICEGLQSSSDATDGEIMTSEKLRAFNDDNDLDCQKFFQEQNERTPRKKKQQHPKPPQKVQKGKRKRFWGDNPQPTVSYKLKNIYERVLNRPGIEAHRAENDCTMAMEISVSIAKRFVEWVDNNHTAFADIIPMRPGVPLGE